MGQGAVSYFGLLMAKDLQHNKTENVLLSLREGKSKPGAPHAECEEYILLNETCD
jgi:hypothetical protein